MNEASVSGILDFWQKTGLYLVSPLEVNFIINLGWVVLSSILRSSSDYRLRQSEGNIIQTPFTFLSFKLILFLFSFIATFSIFISFSFWFDFYEVKSSSLLWWTPSAASIFLAEFSHLAASLLKGKEEEELTMGEKIIERGRKELPIYFMTLFLGLTIFCLAMILSNRERLVF